MKIINEGLIDTSFLVTFGATPGPDSVHQSVQFSASSKPLLRLPLSQPAVFEIPRILRTNPLPLLASASS